MKAFVFVLLLFVVIAPTLHAQSPGGMPPGHQMLADPNAFADGHVAALDRQVQLSADQKAKLRPVFLEEGKKLFAIIGDNSLSTEQKQAIIQKLHLETAAHVNELLTPEQRRQAAPGGEQRPKSQAGSQNVVTP